MRRVMLFVLALVAVLAMPEEAHACAVCFDATDENRQAFLATTALLTLLPLGMVAGTGYWLRRRARDRDAEEALSDTSTD